jgi:hypothetical protein
LGPGKKAGAIVGNIGYFRPFNALHDDTNSTFYGSAIFMDYSPSGAK